MTMSDPLAEALYDDICRRATVTLDDWKDAPEFQRRYFEALAKAARAFIGDEINAKYEAAKPILNRWDPRDDGYEYGLDIAEQIARGDTK
jgi:hypothetical protein